jgi:hypothetical protein
VSALSQIDLNGKGGEVNLKLGKNSVLSFALRKQDAYNRESDTADTKNTLIDLRAVETRPMVF